MSTTTSPHHLAIVSRRIDELTPDPRNPRQHSKAQVKRIARSIRTFGFNVPILVDASGRVIAGHGRLLACRELGWTEVPTITLDHLTEAQRQSFMIADNRLTEIATWDDRLLAETFRDLATADLNFDLELTGFEMAEIDLRIGALDGSAAPPPDPADAVPPPLPGPAISRLGDLWHLGRHRLACGNALDPLAYAALMGAEQAAMVFTDPPYNVPISGHVSGLGDVRHREFVMASGEMSAEEFTTFLTDSLKLAATHSRDGALHFVCMDWRHMGELLAAGGRVYGQLKNLCVWAKDNAGMGSLYRSQHELVFVYKHGSGRHRNNIELGRHGRHRSNVWRYPGVNSFDRATEEGNLLALHPTVKPVSLVADAILDCTTRNDLVLDPFLGSGTTLMAAERGGRRCVGLELDPLYVDTIIRRWQRSTGDTARLASTGQSFDERIAEGGRHG